MTNSPIQNRLMPRTLSQGLLRLFSGRICPAKLCRNLSQQSSHQDSVYKGKFHCLFCFVKLFKLSQCENPNESFPEVKVKSACSGESFLSDVIGVDWLSRHVANAW